LKIQPKYAIALTASIGLFMAILDNTIINVALTPIQTALGASLSSIQWVITGYFLAQAAAIPVAGYFSNRFGSKLVFLVVLSLFTVGSLLCGFAQDEGWLIFFRVIQGLGGGGLFPVCQAIALGAFPPQERANASALISVPILLAPVFGPTIGGILTDSFTWSSIFFVNIPVGIAAAFLAWRIFPAGKPSAIDTTARFDYVGLSLVTIGVLSVIYGFNLVTQSKPGTETVFNPRGNINGWGEPGVWMLIGVGLLLMVAFAVYELRYSKDPVLDLNLFKNYNFTIASIVIWFNAMVVFGSLILLPIFLEQIRQPNLKPTDVGLALMPVGLASIVTTALAGRVLYSKLGTRLMAFVGVVLLAVSSFMLTSLTASSDWVSLLPAFVVRGLGFGLTFVPVQTLALQSFTGRTLPKASSLFNITRQIFSSIGIAIITTLYVQEFSSRAKPLQDAALARIPAGVTFDPNSPQAKALAAQAREQIAAQAGVPAMNQVFLYLTIALGVMRITTLFLPSLSKQNEAVAQAQEAAQASSDRPQMVLSE